MTAALAKKELDSLCEYQHDIHKVNSSEEELMSIFYRPFTKSTWYSSVLMKLTETKEGDTVKKFTANNSFHYLMYTYLTAKTSRMEVSSRFKDRIRICWCHNLGLNYVQNASLKIDDDVYQKFDNTWLDFHTQFFQLPGAGKRESNYVGIGTVRCLEEWTTFLPEYNLDIAQPWYYSSDPSLAFPIFYKNSMTKLSHFYTFREQYTQLLRMQIKTPEGWKNVLPDDMHQYLESPNTLGIREPELWGKYSLVTEKEINYMKCKEDRMFFYKDVVSFDNVNPFEAGQIATTEHLTTTNPCMAIFWVAENQGAIKYNNYSNYTTCDDDLYSGWDPILKSSLKYQDDFRFKDMESHHFNIAESRTHFRSAPSEQGYHAHSIAWDHEGVGGDIGLVFDNKFNPKLTCKLAEAETKDYSSSKSDIGDLTKSFDDFDRRSSLSRQENRASKQYILRVRMLIGRKLKITKTHEGHYDFVSL